MYLSNGFCLSFNVLQRPVRVCSVLSATLLWFLMLTAICIIFAILFCSTSVCLTLGSLRNCFAVLIVCHVPPAGLK